MSQLIKTLSIQRIHMELAGKLFLLGLILALMIG